MTKKKHHRGFSPARWVLLAVCVAVFLCSGYTLVSHYTQKRSSLSLNETLIEAAVKPVKHEAAASEAQEEEAPAQSAASPEEGETPARAEITETAPLEVDFEALGAKIGNTVAWVDCPDTVINYPVMQAEDNQFYVKHLPNGREGYTGSIFMDYRNMADFSDYISVIYGHNMRDGSMFASLQKYRNQEYYDQHPTWYILTPTRNYKVTLLAGYIVEHDSATYQVLNNIDERNELLEYALDHSCFKTEAEAPEDAPLVCFSTCSYDFNNARFVLMGSLSPVG